MLEIIDKKWYGEKRLEHRIESRKKQGLPLWGSVKVRLLSDLLSEHRALKRQLAAKEARIAEQSGRMQSALVPLEEHGIAGKLIL